MCWPSGDQVGSAAQAGWSVRRRRVAPIRILSRKSLALPVALGTRRRYTDHLETKWENCSWPSESSQAAYGSDDPSLPHHRPDCQHPYTSSCSQPATASPSVAKQAINRDRSVRNVPPVQKVRNRVRYEGIYAHSVPEIRPPTKSL